MSAADKMSQWRLEGMYYAYEKIKQSGIEEFEKELSFRSKRGVQIINTKADIMKYEREIIERTQDVAMIFCIAVLVDEFDFTREDILRFQERLALKADCISEKYLTWDEQKQILKDEYDIEVRFRSEDERG